MLTRLTPSCWLAGYPKARHGDAGHRCVPSRETGVPEAPYGQAELFWRTEMLRTIFMIGMFALLWVLLWWAIKIAIVGLIIYFVIRIVSPDTANRLRSHWSGPAT